MKLPEVDSVAIHKLSPDTQHAITEALFDSGFDVGKSWIDFDLFCGIVQRLKVTPDCVELFPKGKWATIQHMEQLIADAIKVPTP